MTHRGGDLDAGRAWTALAGRLEPAAHYAHVRAWEDRRRRQRRWADAVGGVVILGAMVGLVWLLIYVTHGRWP